jgi:hypothetical protein
MVVAGLGHHREERGSEQVVAGLLTKPLNLTAGLPSLPSPTRPLRRRKSQPEFDYSAFPDHVQQNLRTTAASIHDRLGIHLTMGSALDVVQVGLWLHEVRRCVGRKLFPLFLTAEFRWRRSTACRLMKSATYFQHIEPECLERFGPTALYVLSTKYVPQSARDEAIELARAGKQIKKSVAEEIVYRHAGLTASAVEMRRAEKILKKAFETAGDCPDDATIAIARRLRSRLIKRVKHWKKEGARIPPWNS